MPEWTPANKDQDLFSYVPEMEPDERTEVERSNWRDQQISERHRRYGYRMPAVDVDFLLVEAGGWNMPKAIIEYKHQCSDHQKWIKKSGVTILRNLGLMARIPFVVAFYDDRKWSFHVYPLNFFALKFLDKDALLTEQEFVRILYRMRDMEIRPDEEARIKTLLDIK